MSTSSSDRCTRISPSAVLDDRLHGKDLEWARDHLRRCESCRERVEDFREMMMRVGRLPSAPIGPVAMDAAFAAAIPERVRAGAGAARGFAVQPLPIDPVPEPILDLPPQPVRPEVSNVRDLLTDLEREIFRDEPIQDHPTAMPPGTSVAQPPVDLPVETQVAAPVEGHVEQPVEAHLEQPVEAAAELPVQPKPEAEHEDPIDPLLLAPGVPGIGESDLRQVEVTSRQATAEAPQNGIAGQPTPAPPPEATPSFLGGDAAPDPVGEPPAGAEPKSGRSDTVMRVAVGLGAAACVILAAFLYEGGLLTRGAHKSSATAPRPTATAHALPAASTPPSASATPAEPAAPPAPVLFRLGNGVTGGTVYRIRPGTAVAGYTRLVFDIRGRGLPSMVITQPDALHVAITFAGTDGAAVPVKGIRSFQVAAVEPASQQGPDLVIVIDLARPDRVTAFTLPAAGAYASRLVVDLHSS